MAYYCYRILMALSGILSRPRRTRVARFLARLYFFLGRKARAGAMSNMRVVLGPEATDRQVRETALASFYSFGIYMAEFFSVHREGTEAVCGRVPILNRNRLDEALRQGKGCLLISAHYSNWELGAMVLGEVGYPIAVITMEHDDPRVNKLFVEQRVGRGVTVKHTKQGGLAGLKALKKNRPLALHADRTTGGPVIAVTMFGRRTEFPQGPWRLAEASGAPILPAFTCRLKDGSYELRLGDPLPRPRQPAKADRVVDLAQSFARVLEQTIKADPGQWEMFYPVWPEVLESPAFSETAKPLGKTDNICENAGSSFYQDQDQDHEVKVALAKAVPLEGRA